MAKVPENKFPVAPAAEYFDNMMDLVEIMHNKALDFFDRKVGPAIRRADSYRLDDEVDAINRELDNLKEEAVNKIFEQQANKMAKEFVTKVKSHSVKQVGKQVKTILGFDPLKRDPKMQKIVKAAVKENVSYIKSIPERYHRDLERITLNGLRSGSSIKETREKIEDLRDKAENNAKLIAQDQAGSIHGDITKTRHNNLDLEKFIWRDSDDSRVRKDHKKFDGNTYTWEEGAGAEGELPGKPIRCRCNADLVPEELEEKWAKTA